MLQLTIQHLLSGTELSAEETQNLIQLAMDLKQQRQHGINPKLLVGKHLALMFEKPSLRTRFSFTVAMNELGGQIIESVNSSRKKEEPEDQIRVLQGYCHAMMCRTHEDSDLARMQAVAEIPIINGLSNLYHPCQSLADLMTLQEKFGTLKDITLSYVGDGNNVLHSLLLMAPAVGVHIRYACPKGHEPDASVLQQAHQNSQAGTITACDSPPQAVTGCHAVYTDVWTSMGFAQVDEDKFAEFQVNKALMAQAHPNAIFMHCMPMNRGKEVSQTLPDEICSVIFQQSENRLHVQKALLVGLLS